MNIETEPVIVDLQERVARMEAAWERQSAAFTHQANEGDAKTASFKFRFLAILDEWVAELKEKDAANEKADAVQQIAS